jgi:hypothetical protein
MEDEKKVVQKTDESDSSGWTVEQIEAGRKRIAEEIAVEEREARQQVEARRAG